MHDSDQDGLQRRNRDLEILNQVATALNESLELSQSLEVALSHITELLGLRTGWVWLLSEADGTPYLAAARNLPPGLADRPEKMEGSCYCLDTFRAGDLAGAANVNVVTCSRLRCAYSNEVAPPFRGKWPGHSRGSGPPVPGQVARASERSDAGGVITP